MSDGVWVALIAASAAVVGPVILALVNHHLGQQDRELATRTVEEQGRMIRTLRTRLRTVERENRLYRLRRAKRRGRS